jgi:hypothetical protein
MIQTAAKTHIEGGVFITEASEVGACVVSADPPFTKGLLQYNGI